MGKSKSKKQSKTLNAKQMKKLNKLLKSNGAKKNKSGAWTVKGGLDGFSNLCNGIGLGANGIAADLQTAADGIENIAGVFAPQARAEKNFRAAARKRDADLHEHMQRHARLEFLANQRREEQADRYAVSSGLLRSRQVNTGRVTDTGSDMKSRAMTALKGGGIATIAVGGTYLLVRYIQSTGQVELTPIDEGVDNVIPMSGY